MKGKILVVDDEPDILSALSMILSEEFEVQTALGGRKAIALFASEPFDLVITDLKMPDVDGIEVMKQIRQLDEDVEFIVLTGFASVDTAIKALKDCNAYDYLSKPLEEIDEIFISIQRALEKKRLVKENRELVATLREANETLERRVRERTEELAKSYEEVKQARISAEIALRAKNDFIGCMSHELRTPLNAILGFTDLISSDHYGELNSTQRQYLGHVTESGELLLTLVNNILDFANAGSNMDLKLSAIDLNDILRLGEAMIKDKITKRNLSLSKTIEGLPGPIMADPPKLRQILYNLLSNAVKFTPDCGEVILKAGVVRNEIKGVKTDMIEVAVADTGIGLESKDLERIFNPFEQLEALMTRQYDGAGLGLFVAKKFVELHGGRIWAESQGKGKGSVFRFVIPVRTPKIGEESGKEQQKQ